MQTVLYICYFINASYSDIFNLLEGRDTPLSRTYKMTPTLLLEPKRRKQLKIYAAKPLTPPPVLNELIKKG